jgi:TPR repeat protein
MDPPRPPLEECCALCRAQPPEGEEFLDRLENRMKVNDPQAFLMMACYYEERSHGLPKDKRKAFELTLRAAELGLSDACYNLAVDYREGIVTSGPLPAINARVIGN